MTKTVHKTHSAGGGEGERGLGVTRGLGVVGVGGVGSNDIKLALSLWHDCLKLRVII